MNFKKLPIIRRVYDKINGLKSEISELKKTKTLIAKQAIDYRLALKKINGEKINVVFICMRPAIWGSLKTVYEAFRRDKNFDVKIIAIPNKNKLKKKDYNHEIYDSEGAEEFFKGENCVNGYDYEKNTWINPKTLKPDYVFIQQPYNLCRSKEYQSDAISEYAKICYVPYYGTFSTEKVLSEVNPKDFLDDVSLYFTENKFEQEYLVNLAGNNGITRFCLTGFPRFDLKGEYPDAEIWHGKKENEFRILWTPRWTTNEGNCGFFEFKDKLLDYCKDNYGIKVVFRPHPQMKKEMLATGEFSEKDWERLELDYAATDGAFIDRSKDYMPLLYSSDVLFTDKSSMIVDFYPTGKPIIFFDKNSKPNPLFDEFRNSFYKVTDYDGLKRVLDRLKTGEDPLKPMRERVLKEILNIGTGNIGEKVKESIKADAEKDIFSCE